VAGIAKNLITHLLCVDPAERYTIDEFLAHPWCHAAPAPPPPPTPAVDRPYNAPLDSPLLDSLRRGRPEGRSPGLSTLKEAFDVTYAVHRMEEEGARRRAYNGPRGAGARGFLHELNEDDEEEAMYERSLVDNARRRQDIHHQEQQVVDASVIPNGSGAYDGRAGARDLGGMLQQRGRQLVSTRARHNHSTGFELDISGATLLGRRHHRAGKPSPLHHNLIPDQVEFPNTPSSPMRDLES
jgi:serine/threonine-protein kinase RCK2